MGANYVPLMLFDYMEDPCMKPNLALPFMVHYGQQYGGTMGCQLASFPGWLHSKLGCMNLGIDVYP